MGNSINFNQTGGTASIGNIVQGGDGSVNSANATVSTTEIDKAFAQAVPGIVEYGRRLQRSDSEIQDVIAQLRALQAAAKEPAPDKAKGASILAVIRENFSWVYPMVKDVISVAWPALLAGLHF